MVKENRKMNGVVDDDNEMMNSI